jgi:CrcB protein
MLQTYLWVMTGGALGVGARLFLSNWIEHQWGQTFPWGIFVINVSGCFIIGLFSGLTGPDSQVLTSPLARQVVMVGILGGYTTFSSFSLQTINLLSAGELLFAFLNVSFTVLLCLLGTWSGLLAAGLMHPK